MEDNYDEYYERGSLFFWNGGLFILTSIPQMTETNTPDGDYEDWIFCLISLNDGNRLNNPVIKRIYLKNGAPKEVSCLFIKKNSPLFTLHKHKLEPVKDSTEIMEHIIKSVLLFHQI